MRNLTATLLAALAAFGAWAETETVGQYTWTYQINGETAEICNNSSVAISPNPTGAVAIPSTLGGKPVTSIWHGAFSGCSGLTSVTIPDSVTSIGYAAFYNCIGLASVTIPDSVTSIEMCAFEGCKGLTSVMIPASVTYIGCDIGCGMFAFGGCDYIREATVPGWRCGLPFYNVTNLVISAGTTSISNAAFSGCSGITSVTIPDSVTSIGSSAFSGCSGLTSVIIPDSVTRIGSSAFSDCSGLTSVTILGSEASIVSSAFSGCNNLQEATVPGWRCCLPFDNVTNLVVSAGTTRIRSNAFSGCRSLTSVTISDHVTSIGASAFSGCSGLTSVMIPDSVTSIGDDAFLGCSGLVSIHVNDDNPSYQSANGCLLSKDGKTLIRGVNNRDVVIPDGVVSILNNAFSGCCGLRSVTIPDSVTSIGYGAFKGCSGLTSVLMPRISHSGGVFSGCSPDLMIRYWEYQLTLKPNATKYGMVTGGGAYIVKDEATITAVANVGYAFAGWFMDKACTKPLNPKGCDNRNTTVKFTIPKEDTTIYAKFVTKTADGKSLKFSTSTKKLATTPAKATAGAAYSLKLGISSASLPTVTAKDLPKGLSIDKATGKITGTATVPGSYTAKVTVKSAAGNKITQDVKINVLMPSWAKGTFYGVANPVCKYFCDPRGYLKFTVGSDGGISGKVAFWDEQKQVDKNYSFTSTCKSCTATRATFSIKKKIGSFTFKSGKVTVSKKSVGGVVVVEAVSAGGSHAISAQKKPGLVKKGKALASLVGKKFTFTKSNTPYDIAYVLNQSGGKLKVSLANGDAIRLSYVAGGKTIISKSWALTLSEKSYNANEYMLYADFFDRRLAVDGFTFNLNVTVNNSGKVTGVSAEINSSWW